MLWFNKRKDARDAFRAQAKERFQAEGYTTLFQADETDALPPDFPDLWLLREAVVASKPSVILEYGAGYSTYVLAETLYRLGKGKLYSVELDTGWKNLAAARIPQHLTAIVEFLSPESTIKISNAALPAYDLFKKKSKKARRIGIATVTFPDLHILDPDFIFIDGPAKGQIPGYADHVTSEMLTPIVSDALVFCQRKRPTICVDGRREQTAFLGASLPEGYRTKIHESETQPFTFFYPPGT
jgi:hypothetical protein